VRGMCVVVDSSTCPGRNGAGQNPARPDRSPLGYVVCEPPEREHRRAERVLLRVAARSNSDGAGTNAARLAKERTSREPCALRTAAPGRNGRRPGACSTSIPDRLTQWRRPGLGEAVIAEAVHYSPAYAIVHRGPARQPPWPLPPSCQPLRIPDYPSGPARNCADRVMAADLRSGRDPALSCSPVHGRTSSGHCLPIRSAIGRRRSGWPSARRHRARHVAGPLQSLAGYELPLRRDLVEGVWLSVTDEASPSHGRRSPPHDLHRPHRSSWSRCLRAARHVVPLGRCGRGP